MALVDLKKMIYFFFKLPAPKKTPFFLLFASEKKGKDVSRFSDIFLFTLNA